MSIPENVNRQSHHVDDQNNLDYAVAQHPHELITYMAVTERFSKLGTIPVDYAISVRNDR
jgi:hypothetical protein